MRPWAVRSRCACPAREDGRRQVLHLRCGAVGGALAGFLFRARDVLEPLECGRYVIIRRSGESHTFVIDTVTFVR